jgi:hypothetical protein
MVRIGTGIRDIDDFIAARGDIPPEATDVRDVEPDARALTVSRMTRNLERLAELPALRRLAARAPRDETLRLIGGAVGVEDLALFGGTVADLVPLSGLQKLRYPAISVASCLWSLDGIEGPRSRSAAAARLAQAQTVGFARPLPRRSVRRSCRGVASGERPLAISFPIAVGSQEF